MHKLILATILLFPPVLTAGSYNAAMLQLYARVFAKIVYSIHHSNTFGGDFNVTIIHQPPDESRRQRLRALLEKEFDALKLSRINITSATYTANRDRQKSHALFLLPGSDRQIDETCRNAEHAFTFTAEPRYLDLGAVMSLSVTRGVELIINADALKRSDIRLGSAILRVSRLVHASSDKPISVSSAEGVW